MTDTVLQLEEAVVKGYISKQPLLQTPTSVGIVTSSKWQSLADETLLPAINSIPGVRTLAGKLPFVGAGEFAAFPLGCPECESVHG